MAPQRAVRSPLAAAISVTAVALLATTGIRASSGSAIAQDASPTNSSGNSKQNINSEKDDAVRGAAGEPLVGAYWLVDSAAPAKLSALVAAAGTLPITRLVISFLMPDMTYIPGSFSLCNTGLNYSTTGDCGYADISAAVKALQNAGVEVFLR